MHCDYAVALKRVVIVARVLVLVVIQISLHADIGWLGEDFKLCRVEKQPAPRGATRPWTSAKDGPALTALLLLCLPPRSRDRVRWFGS
jgi:hypothetical protein